MDTWIGTVISVRGAVVDVGFKGQTLPPINTALAVQWDRPEPLVLEVHSHVDSVTVRGIALQATAGLARNTKVQATSVPISVPVGEAVLGRLLDVVGEVCDRGPALPANTPRRPIHNPPPTLEEETSTTRSSRPASRSSICLRRWPKAARRRCSAAPASARPCW